MSDWREQYERMKRWRETIASDRTDAVVSTETFGWRVLQTLADVVSVHHSPDPAGNGPTVGIRLDKFAGDPGQ